MCAEPGRLTEAEPAAVLVLAYSDGLHVVRLAHMRCLDSGVITMTDTPEINPAVLFPAVAWLRPGDCNPAPVLVIGPRAAGMRLDAPTAGPTAPAGRGAWG